MATFNNPRKTISDKSIQISAMRTLNTKQYNLEFKKSIGVNTATAENT